MKANIKLLCILCMIMMATPIPAFADTVKPPLVVSDISIAPGAFMAGDQGEITVTVMNSMKSLPAGDSQTTTDTYSYPGSANPNVSETSNSYSRSVSVTTENTPQSLIYLEKVYVDSSGPVHVVTGPFSKTGSLGIGDSAKFTFKVQVDDNAADGLYYLSLGVLTRDDDVYLNYPIPVEVDNSQVNLVLSQAPGSFGTVQKNVVFDVVNLRPDGINSVSIIPSGDQFTFQPVQEYYVGDIGANEMYTAQFGVASKNASYDESPQFKVVYKNGDNWHESALSTVLDMQDVQATSGNGGSMALLAGMIGVAIIVLGGLFMLFRGKRAKQ